MNQEILLEEYKGALRVVWKKLMRESIIAMVLITLVLTLIGLVYVYILGFPIEYVILDLFIHALMIIWIFLILIHFIETNKVDIIINEIENRTYMSNLDKFKHAFRKALKQRYMKNIKIYLLISILIIGIMIYVFQMGLITVGFLFLFILVAPLASWDEIIEKIEEETMKKLSK